MTEYTKSALDLFSWDEFEQFITSGHIAAHRHPELPLTLYLVTEKAKIEYNDYFPWPLSLNWANGLILEDDRYVVARGCPHRFNWEKLRGPIPIADSATIRPLMADGTWGIVYQYRNTVGIATAQGWEDPLAFKWTEKLLELPINNQLWTSKLYTTFHVLMTEENVQALLAVGTTTGIETQLTEYNCPLPNRVPSFTYLNDSLLQHAADHPGQVYVITFRGPSPFHAECNRDDLVHIQRMKDQFSARKIYRCLAEEGDWKDFVERIPAEFRSWAQELCLDYLRQYATLEQTAIKELTDIYALGYSAEERSRLAPMIEASVHKEILWALVDNKSWASATWRKLTPPDYAAVPYKEAIASYTSVS